MSTQELNRKIVTRFNIDFIQNGNAEAFHQMIAPDFFNHSAPPGISNGPEGILFFFNEVLRFAFPNLKVTIYDQIAEGDKVTTRKDFRGTHSNTFLGIPATGRSIVMDVIDIVRLEHGLIVEHWNIVDWQKILNQITSHD